MATKRTHEDDGSDPVNGQWCYLEKDYERFKKGDIGFFRIPLSNIGFARLWGGQGIMPPHVHDIAYDVCMNMTSVRRYRTVFLVVVPEKFKVAWRNDHWWSKSLLNPLFPTCTQDLHYACLTMAHFVGAHKLIAEGNRTFMDRKNGLPLKLMEGDEEGQLIQKQGVRAVVFKEELWYEPTVLMALMREDNANQEIGAVQGDDVSVDVTDMAKDASLWAAVDECAAVSLEAAKANSAYSAAKNLVHLIGGRLKPDDRREADEAKDLVYHRLKESLGLCSGCLLRTVSLLSRVPNWEIAFGSPAFREGALSHWEVEMPTQPDIHNDANDEGDDSLDIDDEADDKIKRRKLFH